MKPQGPVFDSSWRASCSITTVSKNKIEDLIKAHYLKAWPKNIQLTFGLKRKGKLIGVITYSDVVNEIKSSFGQNIWELSRLFIIDSVPTNGESFFIAGTIRHLKKNYPTLKKLISFADPEYGHSGVVYKASNWKQFNHASKNLFVYDL